MPSSAPVPPPPGSAALHLPVWHNTLESSPTILSLSLGDARQPFHPLCVSRSVTWLTFPHFPELLLSVVHACSRVQSHGEAADSACACLSVSDVKLAKGGQHAGVECNRCLLTPPSACVKCVHVCRVSCSHLPAHSLLLTTCFDAQKGKWQQSVSS